MASETQQIENFVKEALEKGSSRSAIEQALTAAGWSADQIRNGLNAFADVNFLIPVPRPRPSLKARDAFLYLLMFSALYFGAGHLGELLFSFIDRAFPDPAERNYYGSLWDSQRWSTAAIIIAFPLFFFIAHVISRDIEKNPVKRLSPVRRWLTYMTLFIASSFLIGDMTTLIYNILGGEVTMRFAMKVLTVAAIAGTGFGYYLLSLRKEEKE